MFVPAAVPPGDPETTYGPQDYYNMNYHVQRDWYSDYKNQGTYPLFITPGSYSLTTPPLRPGRSYYLGFWSLDDTTFSVNVVASAETMPGADVLAFYGGSVTSTLPAFASALYRVDVPPEATRWRHFATNTDTILFKLEQGTIPLSGGNAHWTSSGASTSLSSPVANYALSAASWPFQPAQIGRAHV